VSDAAPEPINARLEAFSDGVFAVAITLLALNLAVDGPGHGTSLARQLGDRWPAFVAYVVSFFTIGIVWVNHHALMRGLRRDQGRRALPFLNLVLLLFVVAIPFGTATVADYLRAGGSDAHLAAALYNAIMLGMAVSFGTLFVWAIRADQFVRRLTGAEARRATVRFGIGNLVYVTAVGVAFISPPASLAISALIDVYYIAERTPSGGS
jgi:uncharacterized membrane protein